MKKILCLMVFSIITAFGFHIQPADAADKVSGTPYRNHFLNITKVSGCGDVGITGFYGFEHQMPDYSS
ncbi:hypothetical protein MOJ76_10250 [Bacillus haynesii]|uniref:hypothetical protein n=1 Tax=Bacillus haynesii TaxID=1925021 RepID=UPI002280DE4F|nr:hypothetical protein [Bacillus haynesii]MCY8008686.1 hypothetical protein [Bacillus haynesii]